MVTVTVPRTHLDAWIDRPRARPAGGRRRRLRRVLPLIAFVVAGATGAEEPSNDTARHHRTVGYLGGMDAGDGLRSLDLFVSRPVDIVVSGVGAGLRPESLYAFGWLLDDRTAMPVWSMFAPVSPPVSLSPGLFRYRHLVRLQPGRFRLYFFAGRRGDAHEMLDLSHFIGARREMASAWSIVLTLVDEADDDAVSLHQRTVESTTDEIRLAPLTSHTLARRRFRVIRPVSADIVALGESYRDGQTLADTSRLIELESRRVVWEMKAENSVHAGGSKKNRLVRARVDLVPANYELIAMTDDSHADDDWNAPAPWAPAHWGVTLRLPSGYSDQDVPPERPIVRLIGAHDDEHMMATFRLDRETRVRVYVIGESTSAVLADSGWIESALDGTLVWSMADRTTEYAGGAGKNRVIDDSLTLPAGTYRAHFQTDDSHSPGGWNSARPTDATSWGITVTTFDDAPFELLDIDVEGR